MTEPAEQTPQIKELASMPGIGRGYQVQVVAYYLELHRGRFTEESLAQMALRQGYSEDVVQEARARVRAKEASAPARRRARRWIVVAYLVTFAALTAGMLLSEYAGRYGAGYIGTIILAVTLGLALLVSLGWLGWRGGKVGDGMALLLSVPIVLLVTIAGLCVATGLPIARPL